MCAYFQIKLYESVKPLQIEVDNLRGWNKALEAETAKFREDLRKTKEVSLLSTCRMEQVRRGMGWVCVMSESVEALYIRMADDLQSWNKIQKLRLQNAIMQTGKGKFISRSICHCSVKSESVSAK